MLQKVISPPWALTAIIYKVNIEPPLHDNNKTSVLGSET